MASASTHLPLLKNKLTEAFQFLHDCVWSKSEEEQIEKFKAVGASRLDFSIVCQDDRALLRIRIGADNPTTVKDGVLKSDDPFWQTFVEQLDAVMPTPLGSQPCILV